MEEKVFVRLRNFNLIMGFFHLVQGLVMLALSNDFALNITTSFLQFDRSRIPPIFSETTNFLELRVGPAIAIFLFLSAFAHFLISTVLYKWYVSNLKKNINYARWYEYAISSSIMIVAIAMLSGIYELSALIGIFGLNAIMNLFGLMMELHNQTTKKTDWTAYILGCIAGIIPWIIIAIYFLGAIWDVRDVIPQFVYWILFTIFIFFNTFAINMYLQYKKVWKWKDYLFGERMYIVLSLVAKSALAWQIFFGTLRP